MKYESNTKTERNEAVKRMRKEHPELSLEDIGARFNITRQRVSQILSKGKNGIQDCN